MSKLLVSLMIASAAAFTAPGVVPTRAAVLPARAPLAMAEAAKPKEPERSFPNTAAHFRDSPSDDPTVSCFLAPDWMGSTQWVCSDTNFHDQSSLKRKSYNDDSF